MNDEGCIAAKGDDASMMMMCKIDNRMCPSHVLCVRAWNDIGLSSTAGDSYQRCGCATCVNAQLEVEGRSADQSVEEQARSIGGLLRSRTH